jgi:hypothetical protein
VTIAIESLLGIVKNRGRSSWHFNSSGGGLGLSIGLGPIAGGVARGYFDVTSTVHTVDHYRCYYRLLTGGSGPSLLPFSGNLGPGSLPSSELDSDSKHPLGFLRLPEAPDQSGEGGDPSGFLGPCLIGTISAAAGVSGDLFTLILGNVDDDLDLFDARRKDPFGYKYIGVAKGLSLVTNISAGGSIGVGNVVKIINMSRGGVEVRRTGTTLDYPPAAYSNKLDF